VEPPSPRGLAGRVVGRVTGRVVDVVDPDLVLDHIDVNALLDRIDVNRLMARIDVEALLARIDPNVLLRDVDVEALVRRSGIPEVVADTTREMAGSTLNLARRQVAGLDYVVSRALLRVLRRAPADAGVPDRLGTAEVGPERRVVTGLFAGSVARAAAYLIDVVLTTTLFTAGLAGLDYLTAALLGTGIVDAAPTWAYTAALVGWAFLYQFVSLVIAGRTPGKGIVGLRVVLDDGSPIGQRAAFVRTLTYPLSFALLGLGLLPILVGRRHRALHDMLAGTAVVYDFGDRPAELPSPLSRFLDDVERRGPDPARPGRR
jgi:uncharacterized RDD family membrane protein YckC